MLLKGRSPLHGKRRGAWSLEDDQTLHHPLGVDRSKCKAAPRWDTRKQGPGNAGAEEPTTEKEWTCRPKKTLLKGKDVVEERDDSEQTNPHQQGDKDPERPANQAGLSSTRRRNRESQGPDGNGEEA